MENNVLVERGAITRVGMFPTATSSDVGKTVVVESTDEKGIPNFKYGNEELAVLHITATNSSGSITLNVLCKIVNEQVFVNKDCNIVDGYYEDDFRFYPVSGMTVNDANPNEYISTRYYDTTQDVVKKFKKNDVVFTIKKFNFEIPME